MGRHYTPKWTNNVDECEFFTVYVKDVASVCAKIKERYCTQLKNVLDVTIRTGTELESSKVMVVSIHANKETQKLFDDISPLEIESIFTQEDIALINCSLNKSSRQGESSGGEATLHPGSDTDSVVVRQCLSQTALQQSDSEWTEGEDSSIDSDDEKETTVIEAADDDLIQFSQDQNVSHITPQLTSIFPGLLMVTITIVMDSAKVSVQGPLAKWFEKLELPHITDSITEEGGSQIKHTR